MWHLFPIATYIIFTYHVIYHLYYICNSLNSSQSDHQIIQFCTYLRKEPCIFDSSNESNAEYISNVEESEAYYEKHLKFVEVWSIAAIGSYFWEGIFNAKLQNRFGVNFGSRTINSVHFVFRGGAALTYLSVPTDISHLVLIVNGRTHQKVNALISWFKFIKELPKLQKSAVVLLGNERCENDWIRPYLRSEGGFIDILFVVYDSFLVNNINIFQWPLGVATYRGFPVNIEDTNATKDRLYLCNFLGTVYNGSSRQALQNVSSIERCYTYWRKEWQLHESEETLNKYISVLENSDLTLCPAGINVESYRIYEAMSLGSVPVIEDLQQEGKCSMNVALRLLKQYKAPAIYVKNWTELGAVLEKERLLNSRQKVGRRKNLLSWYKSFKFKLRSYFLETVSSVFFRNKFYLN